MLHSISCFKNGYTWVKCHNAGLDKARDHRKDPRLWKMGEKMENKEK